jgi:hypothetical protein
MNSWNESQPPENYDQYLRRFIKSNVVGNDATGVPSEMPCPFCAAPRFLVYAPKTAKEAGLAGGTCHECKRSARAVEGGDAYWHGLAWEQTGGDDPPAWLLPRMPRARSEA